MSHELRTIKLFLILLMPGINGFAQHTLNVLSFGAKGDGKTDNYNAFRALADSVNKLHTASIFFPEGNYFIAAYHTKDNNIADIRFQYCNGISIRGEKAIISVNGSFRRLADRTHGKRSFSKMGTIIPLDFDHCSNITITGIELNGNVDKMTRDSGVAENGSSLIRLIQCRDISFEHLHLYHSQTDGLYVKGDSSANLSITNSIFSNNARQGMSITGLTGGRFSNCSFINTGITDGNYGRHKPSDGVDIEPYTSINDLIFRDCRFFNNQGGQFVCSTPVKTNDIQLRHCTIEAAGSKRPFQLILFAKNIVVDSCYIDCGIGSLFGTFKHGGSSVEIKNSIIKSATHGIYAYAPDSSATSLNIHDDSIICTNDSIRYYFPNLRVPGLAFNHNKVLYTSHHVITPDGNAAIISCSSHCDNNEYKFMDSAIPPKISNGRSAITEKEPKED